MGEIIISDNKPTDTERWNKLAESCSNLLQSTLYDEGQKMYNQTPVYIEILNNEHLIAGVKLYHYKSRRLPSFISSVSSQLRQFGEIIFDETSGEKFSDVKAQINDAIHKVIKEKKAISFQCSGFYGGLEYLTEPGDYKISERFEFSVAVINLEKTEEQLWNQMHGTHQKNIAYAKKKNLTIFKSDDINLFIPLLTETYDRQSRETTQINHVRKYFALLHPQKIWELFLVSHEGTILSGVLMQKYGNAVYYTFGGTFRNKINAGHYLLWHTILEYKREGYSQFILGQVANKVDEQNLKFSAGITLFKNRFGSENISSDSRTYLVSPLRSGVWNLLQKFFLLLSKNSR